MEKGCVYFFRHVGLKPVKIGYSENESPLNRFNQFNTYAPYGAEIVGFIQSINSKQLETLLHNKFASKRLHGEWFELTDEEINKEIEFHSNIEDIREKAEFQLNFAKYLENKRNKLYNIKEEAKNISKKDKFIEIYKNNTYLNRSKTAEIIGVSRKTIINWISEYNQTHR